VSRTEHQQNAVSEQTGGPQAISKIFLTLGMKSVNPSCSESGCHREFPLKQDHTIKVKLIGWLISLLAMLYSNAYVEM
jgi:hypothetical protein